jgi:ABC-type Fe3+/spermidine/putrescine transport system ATPase subunit
MYIRAMNFLDVSDITKEEQGHVAVRSISFTQDRFQKLAVAGETGSGKTTLLRMIAGWTQPSSGTIHFKGKRVIGPLDQLIPGHPGIAYLSQHFELRNNFWVHEILEYANKLPTIQAETIYSICRIDHLLQRRTDQLSGGEKQRIALARLLTSSPELLLLDEPFSNLDLGHKQVMWSVIEDISHKLGITCLMVLHDATDILSWADRILVLKQGELLQQGSPEEIYREPNTLYGAGLFGEYNLWETSGKKLLIRPENIRVSREGGDRSGIVKNILFKGSHYMLEVIVDGQVLKIQSSHNHFEKNEQLFLSWEDTDVFEI